jgi:hypothetical protein
MEGLCSYVEMLLLQFSMAKIGTDEQLVLNVPRVLGYIEKSF